jgi:signal transduction histidine kinase
VRELSLHILDIAENSIRAQATEVYIEIEENIKQNFFRFFISDNGCGMDEELLKKVRSPFGTSRTTRKVGLGIPLLEEACKRCNGKLDIESTPGKGTTLTVSMEYNHIDRAPMGDIVSTIVTLIGANPHIDFVYKHLYNNSPFN